MDQAMATLTATIGPVLAAVAGYYIVWELMKQIPRLTNIKAAILALFVSATVMYIIQDVTRLLPIGEIPYKAFILLGKFLNDILDSLSKNIGG